MPLLLLKGQCKHGEKALVNGETLIYGDDFMGVKIKVSLEPKYDYPMHPELQIGSRFPDF